ncbi:disulfide bond formation protein DsbA [Effusibacillus lacus]|uniref:Disulfide bond formation protein DsbA n=1 Tax=Effusibacillus lacus TaxID=1348429 RepID=A0A292YDW8_9BACL|nr:disulfide bond formation protein DsbA [Effusibacillus lacus]
MVISLLTVATIITFLYLKPNQMEKIESTKNLDTVSYENLPFLGSQDAPVKIVEFADFKCPGCKAWSQKYLPKMKKDYIDTGKVQLFFVNYPIINESDTAALVGKSIYKQSNSAFWKYYEMVYKNQKSETENWATPTFLFNLVERENLGINLEKLKTNVEQKTYASDVQEDINLAKKAGVHSTPTIFIQGKEVAPFDYTKIQQRIDQEFSRQR